MFISKFLSSLGQPLKDNPWLAHSTNQNFKTRFLWQCDYLFGFLAFKKKSESILQQKWSGNDFDMEDDAWL